MMLKSLAVLCILSFYTIQIFPQKCGTFELVLQKQTLEACSRSTYHPSAQYQTIETTHFKIHYALAHFERNTS
jgi:hypothetical protein